MPLRLRRNAHYSLLPRVLQSYGLVEHRTLGRGFGVGIEVADALELQVGEWLHASCERLYVAVLQDGQRVGVDDLLHGCDGVTLLLFADGSHVVARILHLPQTVVESYLGLNSIVATYPMQRLAFDLTVSTRHPATCLGIVGAIDSGDTPLGILVAGMLFIAFDDIGVLQAHLLARS